MMSRRRLEGRSWDRQHYLCTMVPGKRRSCTLYQSTMEHQCQHICSPSYCNKGILSAYSAPDPGNGNMTKEMAGTNLQVMLAIAESAVTWRSAAILLATRSGHEVPAASAVNAITYGLTPAQNRRFFLFMSSYVKVTSWSANWTLKLCFEYVLTCDAAYLICKLSNTISNTTYEDQWAYKSNPAMCNVVWGHKSKQKLPRRNDQVPKYSGVPQADRIHLHWLRALQLHVLLKTITMPKNRKILILGLGFKTGKWQMLVLLNFLLARWKGVWIKLFQYNCLWEKILSQQHLEINSSTICKIKV